MSWGIGCARKGLYGVYSEVGPWKAPQPKLVCHQVSEYVPWIAHNYGLKSPLGYPDFRSLAKEKKGKKKKYNQ